jgi:hypothetical protein
MVAVLTLNYKIYPQYLWREGMAGYYGFYQLISYRFQIFFFFAHFCRNKGLG